jgi:hypothetical protein
MERITKSVASLKAIKRPELDYPKMKEKLGEILTKNTTHRITKVAYQKACRFYGTNCQANFNSVLEKI